MDHRRVAAVLVLSAVMAVLGHTHEEAVVNLGEHTALTGPVAGKVAQIGESNGSKLGGKAVLMKPKKVGKLEAAHIQYMQLLDESRRVYCKETGGVFCQLMKGLRRQYFGALRSGSKKDYQNYLLRMNVRYCTGPKKNLQSRRCQLIPTFLHKLPKVDGLPDNVGDYIVAPAKQDAYIERKGAYTLKLSEMAEKYCEGKNHKVFCKQLTELVSSYKSAAKSEKQAPRNAYLASFNTVRKQYCERKIDDLTTRCKTFKQLSKVPATRLLAHPTVRIDLDESKLSGSQQKYNNHLKEMQLRECGEDSHPTFCEFVVGMRQSFAAAIKEKDGALHAAFLSKASSDVCKMSPDSKRCATLKLTAGNYAKLEGMPIKKATPAENTTAQEDVPNAAKQNNNTAAKKTNATANATVPTNAAKQNNNTAAKKTNATANATVPMNATEEEMKGTEIAESKQDIKKDVTLEEKMEDEEKEGKKSTEADDVLKKTLHKAMAQAGYKPPKTRTKAGNIQPKASEKKPVTKALYDFGNGHLQNLTPEQQAYMASLSDVAKHYCGGSAKTKDFCGDAGTLKTLFTMALKTQSNTKFKQHLTELRFKKCKSPQQAATKKCKVMEVFAKTVPSVAHSGLDARTRLHQMQQSYLVSTKNAAARYCSVDENSLVCQVTRGLEREYSASLEQKTNIAYEHYLTNMEAQFCSTPMLSKRNPGRCAVFMNLRKTMPISMTTLSTLPEMHSKYIQTLDSVETDFCRGYTDASVACELARGIKRVFIHSLNAESNQDFDFYLTRIQDSFCVLATAEFTKICSLIPTLQKGLPPAFNAEGFKRAIHSTDATKKIAIAQKTLGKRLDQDRQQFLATIQDIQKHYCGSGKDLTHPSYFCTLVIGLDKNYKFSLSSDDNGQFKSFLNHMKRDFCIRGAADGYDKRCKFLPMLEHGLPLSRGEEKKLYHEQGQYLKAMQDVVGHFCYKMTRSVFCQLSHGLVTHFIGAVTDQSNAGMRTYMDNMEAHYCDAVTDKNTKQCQIFSVLRKGMPGVGLGEREAVTTASNVLTAAKSALNKARKARMAAQAAVKKNPSKESLANLEVATHNELAAEKAVRDGQLAEVRKMAEASGAPSTAAINVAVKQAKDLEGLSVKAKQSAVQTKYKTTQQITQAKALVLETTMKVASATEDVKKTTSAENVKAVEKAMTASQDAKVSLADTEKQSNLDIAKADDEATSVADRATNAREKVITLKAAQEKAFAQLAFKRAQQSEDNAEESSVFARSNAKQAAQKLFWARVYAEENPTAANEEKVATAAEEANQEAAVVKAAAGKALNAEERAKLKDEDLAQVDNAVAKAAGSTAVAHSKVKAAKLEAVRAEKEAGKQAAALKGTVPKKEIDVAKGKETQLCGDATQAKGVAIKAKVALEEATAAVKKSANDDTLNALKTIHRKYVTATKASAKAAAACNSAKSLADKLEGNADTTGKTEDQAKTAQLVAATNKANAAQAAVRAAEDEESKATKEKLFQLKHDAAVSADNAQLAAEKLARMEKTVKQQTDLVAHKPSEANIGNMKKALDDRKFAERSKKLADDAVTEANAAESRALMKASEKTKSPTEKAELQSKLADKETSTIKTAKDKLEAAMKAASEATKTVAKDGSEKNKAAARKAAEAVNSMKDDLASATAAANQKKASGGNQRKSIEEVQQALTAALQKKKAAQDVAMQTPTNENLNAFRAEIRTVHSLQTELMIASEQKTIMSTPAKDKTKAGDAKISQLIAGFCQDSQKEEMCKFYTPMEKNGWADEEARMGKQLLEEVASAAQLVEDSQMKVKADRATQASNPTQANKDKVAAGEKQLSSVRSSHLKTEARAAKFAQQTNHMNDISAGKTKKSQFKLQASKLIDYYCKSNKHKKLCAYFTQMKAKSDEAAQMPDKTAFMNNSTDSSGKALSKESIEKAKDAVAANATNATNATDVTMLSASEFLNLGEGYDVTELPAM